jgi:cell division protein FtsZ
VRLVAKEGRPSAAGPDYRDMDQPAYIRNKRTAAGGGEATAADLDYLDIPAFLRRQAD